MLNDKPKRILLINPPTPVFVKSKDRSIPLSLLYIGAFLKKNNHEVKLIDINNDFLNLEEKGQLNREEYFSCRFIDELKKFNPDFVGITCLFSGRFKSAVELSERIKKFNPNISIVIGGIHPTMFPEEVLKLHTTIDYVCIGEGEKSTLELINFHFIDKSNLKNIDGIAYRKGGEIFINPKNSFIEDLDELPFPDYDLINLKDYYFDTSKWYNPRKLPINLPLPILTSRSCPNLCTFCSMFLVHGKRWRARSAKNVVDEIEDLYNKYSHRYFSIMDDNFSLSKTRIIEITNEIIKRGLNIQFDTPNGLSIKTLDKEVMDGLVNAGLIRLCVAPESGSEYIRNSIMKKNISTERIYEFFKLAKDYENLFIKAFFVIGYPQETHETLNETYEMIKRISGSIDQVGIFNLIPFPGTEVYKNCIENGLIEKPKNDLCDDDTFSNYNDSDIPIIKPHKLDIEDLIKFREEAYGLVKRREKFSLKKNKILITGGNGFIGRNLMEYFSKRHEVISPSHKELELTDEISVDEFFKKNKFDIVIHTAVKGGNRKSPTYPDMVKENLKMFFNLVNNSDSFKKMIFIGSGAEFNKSESISRVKEEDFGLKIPKDDYGFYKYICSKYIEKSENIVSLRVFGIFGKYEDYETRLISNVLCRIIFDLPIEINQNSIFDYVYINDFCNIVNYFIENNARCKFYNIGGEKPCELFDIMNMIKKITGKDFQYKIKNTGLGKEYTANNSRLKEELKDFKFTIMEDSIKELYSYYLENKDKIKKDSLLLY